MKDKPEQTPTPRTDAAAWGETDVVEASFARQLETELATVTEQVHTLSSEVHTLSSEVHTLGEQRDEYKLVLQSYDCHNHEIATKLEIVTEQRDRLAEALRNAERTCADD